MNRGKQKAAEPVSTALGKQHVDVKLSSATDTNEQSRWSSRTMRGDMDTTVTTKYKHFVTLKL
jgi:hypothetical protein